MSWFLPAFQTVFRPSCSRWTVSHKDPLDDALSNVIDCSCEAWCEAWVEGHEG